MLNLSLLFLLLTTFGTAHITKLKEIQSLQDSVTFTIKSNALNSNAITSYYRAILSNILSTGSYLNISHRTSNMLQFILILCRSVW